MGQLLLLSVAFLVIFWLFKWFISKSRQNSHLASLRGPPRAGFLPSKSMRVTFSNEDGSQFERWVNEYGSVFKITTGLGRSSVMLCDPKAVVHFYSKDDVIYSRLPFSMKIFKNLFGNSMLSTEFEDHRRMRRAVAPAFNTTALRSVLGVFYDEAYKLKVKWDAFFESSEEVVIDVHEWMFRIALDSIGIAGFGHDFKSLDGHQPPITKALSAISNIARPGLSQIVVLLGLIIPQAANIPIGPLRAFRQFRRANSDIASQLLENSRMEKEASTSLKDKSILELLLLGRSSDMGGKLSHNELVGQGTLLFAGHDMTAIVLSWLLVELSRKLEIQEKLREELRQFSTSDPTWEQLMSGLPYLDAIIHETLRLHPPLEDVTRVAVQGDDTIPLSSPIKTADGQMVDSILIPKGTIVTVPVLYVNCCEGFWGPDAKQFNPERWMKGNQYKGKELHGHRHIYTFGDGARICLGKAFALAELKAVVSVLIRNFSFELPDGPQTKVEVHRTTILPRPKLAGEIRPVLRMRVRQVTD